MAKKRYAYLLANKDLRRWYENVARGSVVTADVYLRRLGSFCEDNRLNPKAIPELKDEELYNLLLDAIGNLESKGYAGSYQQSILKAIKSWLNFNGRVLARKIKIKGAQATPTLEKERVPTQPELKRIFLAANNRQRVAAVLLAHSGLRIQVLGNYKGRDGLKLGDFPELNIEGKRIEFEQIPTKVLVRCSLSKAGHHYFTFLSQEGCSYLKNYLEERLRKEEQLNEDSPVLTPKTAKKAFISSTKIGDLLRKALRKAGFGWRPYVLRSYFDTQLMLAESKGYCLRDYRTFWMGHKGDIEHTYTLNKGKLPPNVIEDMRQAYQKSQEFLQTETTTPKEKEIKLIFKHEFLRMSGFSEEEADKLMAKNPSDEELKRAIREKLLGKNLLPNGNGKFRQKVVSLEELNKHLEEGWEFVTQLPENKVIIRFAESLA
jgi:integrase